MVSKSKLSMQALFMAGVAISVAACSSKESPPPPPPPTATTPPVVATPAPAPEDKFGTVFGTDYRAMANSEPAIVNDGDIVAVSLTTEPVDVN